MKKTAVVGVALSLVCGAFAASVKVDFSQEVGRIKPLHGTGQGPLFGLDDFRMFRYLKEAGIPSVRLHDVGGTFGKNVFVDIPNLFRDFDADENDPKSYDFTFTDLYIKNLVENGVEPYFRLGVSIENAAPRVKAYRLYPPKDPAKWARICEHVIRHYTEGWADGFRYKITYWEIWNEPDDFEGTRNQMWWGTWEQFIELYVTAAKHLKKCFPHLQIGGYGSCLGTCEDPYSWASAKESHEDKQRRVRLFDELLQACRREGAPMDFHSFHAYRPAGILTNSLRRITALLKKNGFDKTKIHLTEWNVETGEGVLGTSRQAAAITSLLLTLQGLPVEIAHLYDARCDIGRYAPLFDPMTRRPRQAFYALKDFNVLYRLGTEVACTATGVQARAAKGKDGKDAAVLIVNYSRKSVPLDCDFGGRAVNYCLITDSVRMDTHTELPTELPADSFLLVVLTDRPPLRTVLTFDDSLKDHLLIAAPLLEQHGWRGHFNIVTDWVGQGDRHLTWDDVRELVRRGHEVATHTLSHPNLTVLLKEGRDAEVRRQISASRDLIAEKTGFVPRYLCAPYIAQNEGTDRICRAEGLRPMSIHRINFGSNNQDRVRAVVASLRRKGCPRIDLLHHGVSAADHGGWNPFRDRASFARHLDTLAELERRGEIVVTDYDGCASDCALKAKDWPRHGVVALSFDDRNLMDWERAFPLFAQFGATATFCVSGPIDAPVVAFARRALAEGHEIALHGLHHWDADTTMAKMGAEAYWASEVAPQLDACRAAGIPVRSFAYPNCRHSAATDALFASRGFARLRGSVPGVESPNPYNPNGARQNAWRPVATADAFFVPARDSLFSRNVSNVILGESYQTDLEDILRAVARAGQRGESLSLVSHCIAPDATGINMKTEWLVRLLASANDLGVVVRGLL